MTVNDDGTMGNVTIPAGTLPILDGEEVMYVCLRTGRSGFFLHQGTAKSLQVRAQDVLVLHTQTLRVVILPFLGI